MLTLRSLYVKSRTGQGIGNALSSSFLFAAEETFLPHCYPPCKSTRLLAASVAEPSEQILAVQQSPAALNRIVLQVCCLLSSSAVARLPSSIHPEEIVEPSQTIVEPSQSDKRLSEAQAIT